IARIGFCVSVCLCLTNNVAETPSPDEGAEDVIECTAKNRLNRDHFVAAQQQVIHRVDHGQPRTHVGFVQELYTTAEGGRPQQLIACKRTAVGFLVGRDDRHVGYENRFVVVGHLLAGGTIDKHAVGQVQVEHA